MSLSIRQCQQRCQRFDWIFSKRNMQPYQENIDRFISSNYISQMTTTVWKSKSFLILIFFSFVLLLSIILLIIFQYRPSTPVANKLISKSIMTTTTTTTFSPEELQRLSALKDFLNLPVDHPNPNPAGSSMMMNEFMRAVYRQINDDTGLRRRRKRHDDFALSDQADFIISLPNHSLMKNEYFFEYNASLEHLIYAEFILPIDQQSIIEISSSTFNISINPTLPKNQNWFKINLTKYIQTFPFKFRLISPTTSASSGFLTIYFRRSSHVITRRDLSSFYDNQLVTYPDDPSYCQVRPLRTSFSELNWSSWILEPRSYEMNICSGTCHTQSNMGTYFLLQNLLNQKYPKKIPAPCCKPKRFSSTLLLYYDGPNLVLKRHENMRVVECACSS